MRRFVIFAAIQVITCAVGGSAGIAAGWSFTADAPLSYTFDKQQASLPIPPNTGYAVFTESTATNVSGSKVMLIAPFHIGVGYEDYSAQQKLNVPPCGCSATGMLRLGIKMVDVMVDIPTRLLNIGIGYGKGNADVRIDLPAVVGITVPPQHRVNAEQTFLVLGMPLGMRWDLHLGYHLVSVDRTIVRDSGGNYSKLQESGSMLSAGARLNF